MSALPPLSDRFVPGLLTTIRPSPGAPCLVVTEGTDAAQGRVWDPTTGQVGELLPIAVDGECELTPDGRWVVGLDDGGGSEVGSLVARRVDGEEVRRLTPEDQPIVLRGLEISADGGSVLATAVDDDGHHLLLIPLADPAATRRIFTSTEEAWLGHLSADGTLACVDTTDHNPGVRRAAVTVVRVDDLEIVATADDLPAGPIRAVRFSRTPGDQRILLSTERSGFARPALWDPLTGERRDFDLPDVDGDVLVLDWHPATSTILAVAVGGGIQTLIAIDTDTGADRVVSADPGSYAEPDVASVHPYYWQSFLDADGRPVVVTSSWQRPLHVRREDAAIDPDPVDPVEVPAGADLTSVLVTSADGTRVQLWWAAPAGEVRGTVLDIHGGPNLVTVNAYRPDFQAWLERGFAVATLNYRGSVTFGRAFREGFWGSVGDREIADVDAALDWLQGQGLADPATTFVTGPSYGGHMSLLSVGRLPSRFAGALAVVAMADWASAWAEVNPAIKKSWTSFLSLDSDGSFDASRIADRLEHFSAISYADAVTASVWLHPGSRDTRTPPEQARRYAERLVEAGRDVLLEWFDAGHEPVGIAGAQSEFERELELVEAKLAGRAWSEL